MKKLDLRIPAKNRLHGELQLLAWDIAIFCEAKKDMSLFIGILKNIGLENGYQKFSELKQAKNVKDKVGLFLFLCRKQNAGILG